MKIRTLYIIVCLIIVGGCVSTKKKINIPYIPNNPGSYSNTLQSTENGYLINALEISNVKLGNCVSPAGSISCLEVCGLNSEEVNTLVAPDLILEKTRDYSSLTSFSINTNVKVGGSSVANKICTSTHRIIMEWSRFRQQFLSQLPSSSSDGIVSGVEVGIAVRVIFDVTISSTNLDSKASFGFADMTTALAMNNAKVMVRYDVKGVCGLDLLSNTPPTSISSASDLVNVQGEFYEKIKAISSLWQKYSMGDSSLASNFNFAPINYYVTGLKQDPSSSDFYFGYVSALRSIQKKMSYRKAIDSLKTSNEDYKSGMRRCYSDFMSVFKDEQKTPNSTAVKLASSCLSELKNRMDPSDK